MLSQIVLLILLIQANSCTGECLKKDFMPVKPCVCYTLDLECRTGFTAGIAVINKASSQGIQFNRYVLQDDNAYVLHLSQFSNSSIGSLVISGKKLWRILESIPDNKELRSLMIFETDLIQIPSNLFKNAVKLAKIVIIDSKIRQLPLEVFDGIVNKIHVTEINLERNRIKVIKMKIFTIFPNLKRLSLGRNPITSIEPVPLLGPMPRLSEFKVE